MTPRSGLSRRPRVRLLPTRSPASRAELEQRVEARAVDERHAIEVDDELPAAREWVEPGPRLLDPELVQLPLEPGDGDAVHPVSAQLDALHGSGRLAGQGRSITTRVPSGRRWTSTLVMSASMSRRPRPRSRARLASRTRRPRRRRTRSPDSAVDGDERSFTGVRAPRSPAPRLPRRQHDVAGVSARDGGEVEPALQLVTEVRERVRVRRDRHAQWSEGAGSRKMASTATSSCRVPTPRRSPTTASTKASGSRGAAGLHERAP